VHGQIREERFNFRFGGEEVCARLHAMEADEADNPIDIRTFSMNGVVVEAEDMADFIEQFWLLTSYGVRHMKSPLRRCESGGSQFLYNCPKIRLIATYQGKFA